jgi:hypothetical protein
MGLFVPLYGSFRVCLKWVVLVPAHGPRPQPKPGPTLKYFGLCCAWAMLFSCFGAARQARPKCTPIGRTQSVSAEGEVVIAPGAHIRFLIE